LGQRISAEQMRFIQPFYRIAAITAPPVRRSTARLEHTAIRIVPAKMDPDPSCPPARARSSWLNSTAISGSSDAAPLWLKLAFGGFVAVMVPVYWRQYGPQNFLWLSDLALFATAASVITRRHWPAGMAAVGVLPLELAWTVDFIAGGKPLGLAAYMFDPAKPLYLRALSLFHLAIPPTLLWLLHRLGYDRRSFVRQTAFSLLLLPATWLLTAPEENVNWVYGPGTQPQRAVPPLAYLAMEMAILPALVFWPTHLVLKRLFARR
jgi:hypothetical protein